MAGLIPELFDAGKRIAFDGGHVDVWLSNDEGEAAEEQGKPAKALAEFVRKCLEGENAGKPGPCPAGQEEDSNGGEQSALQTALAQKPQRAFSLLNRAELDWRYRSEEDQQALVTALAQASPQRLERERAKTEEEWASYLRLHGREPAQRPEDYEVDHPGKPFADYILSKLELLAQAQQLAQSGTGKSFHVDRDRVLSFLHAAIEEADDSGTLIIAPPEVLDVGKAWLEAGQPEIGTALPRGGRVSKGAVLCAEGRGQTWQVKTQAVASRPDHLDRQGGELPVVDRTSLERADFITYPEDVQGANCGNCSHNANGVCQFDGEVAGQSVDLRGQPVNERNCCGAWDARGTLRMWRDRAKTTRPVRKSQPADSSGDADTDPVATAELIADVLGGLLGDDALTAFETSAAEEQGKPQGKAFVGIRKWDALQHPRGANGRFIPKGSAEAVASAKAGIDEIRKLGTAARTPEHAKKLADHLSILTVKQLHELKKEYGLKASGKFREQLVAKLLDRLPGAQERIDKERQAAAKALGLPAEATMRDVVEHIAVEAGYPEHFLTRGELDEKLDALGVSVPVQRGEAVRAAFEVLREGVKPKEKPQEEKPAENSGKSPQSPIDNTPKTSDNASGGEKPKPEETTMNAGKMNILQAVAAMAGGAVSESSLRSAAQESGVDLGAVISELQAEGLVKPGYAGQTGYWKPTRAGMQTIEDAANRAKKEAEEREASKREVLRWNPRKNTFDRVREDPEAIDAWRSTPNRIHITEDTRYQQDTSGLDYDRPVKTRIQSKPIGALLPEGVVADKRVIDGKTEYLLKPHTRATREQFEQQEKRRELARLEEDSRVGVEMRTQEQQEELNRRIAELRRELGK